MKKKTLRLRQVLAFDIVILLLMGTFMFVVETRVTEHKQRENLTERLESIQNTFNKSYQETLEVTEIYDQAMQSKAEVLVFLLENEKDVKIDRDLTAMFDADAIYIGEFRKEQGMRYYTAYASDGLMVTIEKDPHDLNEILNNIYTENRILQRLTAMDDMFLIVTNTDGSILYYPDPEFIGKKVETLGVTLQQLMLQEARWLRIQNKIYYTASVVNANLNITISCGIASNNMTANSHFAIGLIFIIICIVFTLLITYDYFSKQQAKRDSSKYYSDINLKRRLVIISMVGLIMIGLSTYYVQTLFHLAMHDLAATNEIVEIKSSSEEAKNGVEKLTEQYNKSYLNKAQITSYFLSRHPELQTKENLKKLSEILDFEFIMMFDMEGNEILSDSPIIGFSISDDPEDQSYAFNVLKNGIPYLVQEAQNDELTGTYRQYIGVSTYNVTGDEVTGFLQIAVSPDKLKNVVAEADLSTILINSVAGTDDNIFAVDMSDGTIYYAITDRNSDIIGDRAVDHGFREEQLKNNYYGYITVDGTKYYMDSFEVDGHYIYVGDRVSDIFSGRILITLISQAVSLLNIIAFSIYMKNRDVVPGEEVDPDLYVDVTTSGGEKKNVNIISRVMRQKIKWNDMTPEGKTGFIIRCMISVFAVQAMISIIFRDYIYDENSIFGFIISGKWEYGLNVFALTRVLLIVFIVLFAMNIIDLILNAIIKMVSPRNETIIRLAKSFIRYVGTLAMLFYCLAVLGFDSNSLLASAGLLTLIIGLGARDLVTDILAGIFIIFENEFQVGDIIEVGGFKGTVLEIGIRSTRILNTVKDVKMINNRNLTNVVNKTRNTSNCDVIINLPFTQEITEVEAMLRSELPKIAEMSPYILSGPSYGGVDDLSGGGVRLSIRAECMEEHKFEVRTLVNHEIKRLFEQYGFQLK
ncbi:MAG: mechanosensitive ion channel [Eubacteriaceae bacterium]|nr:mechanosensitive ion channel [Eubacteriaceae bacterium]